MQVHELRQIRIDLFNRSPEPRENHAIASAHYESNQALLPPPYF